MGILFRILSEQSMPYTDKAEMEGLAAVVVPSKRYIDGHTARPYFLFDKSQII